MKAYALSTVARFKTFAKISGSDDNAIIEILIDQVTEFIEKYCGRRFKETAYTNIKLDSDGGEALYLPQYPVSSSATFTLYNRTTTSNEDSWEVVDTEDYYIDYDTGLVYSVGGGKWVRGRQFFKVNYTAGYSFNNTSTYLSETEAGDVEWACWKLVKTALDQRTSSVGVKSESLADYSVTYQDTILQSQEIKDVLDKYVVPSGVGGGFPNLY